MGLVDYSDSESGSESEQPPKPSTASNPQTTKPIQPSKATASTTFEPLVDRSNPRKLKISLPETQSAAPTQDDTNSDGPRKRARIGGGGSGAFSGFNSFLPAPKRADAASTSVSATKTGEKPPARKIFSLRTGAGPGFDRQADAEMLREQAEASYGVDTGDEDISSILPPPKSGVSKVATETDDATAAPAEPKKVGNPMMFRPLSVARNNKKKKPSLAAASTKAAPTNGALGGAGMAVVSKTSTDSPATSQPVPKPKISLFSVGEDDSSTAPAPSQAQKEYTPLLYTGSNAHTEDSISQTPSSNYDNNSSISTPSTDPNTNSQSLTSIATELNLTKSQQRQLFGRNGNSSTFSAPSVRNFNTDAEYASNEVLRASGDSVTHNPLKSIAPGKHSLKQLVNAAQTQKEALEEHWAQGKGKKKDAGSRYGW